MALIRRLAAHAAVSALLAAVGGCTTPTFLASQRGDPEPLMQLVRAGSIGVDDPQQLGSTEDFSITPLCAVMGSARGTAAVQELLQRGADVNRRCFRTTKFASGFDDLPLDRVIGRAVRYGSAQGGRADLLPVFVDYAQRLIAAGARSETGRITLDEVNLLITKGVVEQNEWQAELAEWRRARERENSEFLSNLVAGVAVVGAVAAIHHAGNAAATVAPSAPAELVAVTRPKASTVAPTVSLPVEPRNTRIDTTPAPAAKATTAPAAAAVVLAPADPGIPSPGNGLPRIVNTKWYDYQLPRGIVPAQWCAKWTQRLRDDFRTSKNTLISIGECTCTAAKSGITNALESDRCEFPYVYQQNVWSGER